MQYRKFGKTGLDVSVLGFGCMRLPQIESEGKLIYDEDESIRMIHRGIELGINYFDTAPYYCEHISENIVGKALKGKRESVYLSTKNPIDNASGDDFEKRLEASLKKLDTDYIDFYHFWGITLEQWESKIDVPDGPLARALKLKERGVLKYLSFSFHDKPENMLEIIKRGQEHIASLLCQYNLLDRSNEAGIKFANEQGLGVVIMGPVGGGRLGIPSKAVADLLPGKVQSSPELALRFVLNNPAVSIALSGMSSMEQLEQNCSIASNSAPLSDSEMAQISSALEQNKKLMDLYCTGCNYCMPCPAGINIPEVFRFMNYHRVYGITDYARGEYQSIGKVPWLEFKDASACVDCGACEDKCPQKLEIRKQLKQTHEVLGATV
ncbi:MAG: aldo/keto reductase [Oscillospiraceae bacterium]|jgi:predicted aldo/keto reductase-like oxidoreductase|nr:aldo/keto reductase [Oscillospiraceae bacterium]